MRSRPSRRLGLAFAAGPPGPAGPPAAGFPGRCRPTPATSPLPGRLLAGTGFALAPATRWGYIVYPAGLWAWLAARPAPGTGQPARPPVAVEPVAGEPVAA